MMLKNNSALSDIIFDIVIIGGGIHGCAIAADAALKGLRVCVIEKNSLASATSSASSNLIHGGLRYLEQYHLKLVHQSLQEQIIWQKRAPHLVSPLAFVLPHEKHLRPKWLLRTGLWIYDHLVFKKLLPKSQPIQRENSFYFDTLQARLNDGFCYYDCETQGAAITIAHARFAQKLGATILTQTQFESARMDQNLWEIQYKDSNQKTLTIQSKALVNATGPWLETINQNIHPNQPNLAIQAIQGSHIILPKLYEGHHAYILQNKDNRIVFALPFTNDTTAIGTTDIIYKDQLETITISEEEKKYLCDVVNLYFEKKISQSDIIGQWSGVRALVSGKKNEARTISREHDIQLTAFDQTPLITIVGGKLTTARYVAEETLKKLKPFLTWQTPVSTKNYPLPGGDLSLPALKVLEKKLIRDYECIEVSIIKRWIMQWGSETQPFLKNVATLKDLGEDFGSGLYAFEVDILIKHFFAKTTDDILFRLTRLKSAFTQDQIQLLDDYMAKQGEVNAQVTSGSLKS